MASGALGALILPLLAATGSVVAWTALLPRVALLLVCVAISAGQVLRVPLPGQGGGLLISDTAALAVLAAAVGTAVRTRRVSRIALQLAILWIPFAAISLLLNVVAASQLPPGGPAISVAYWLRLIATLLVLPALLQVSLVLPVAAIHRLLRLTGFVLLALGAVQLLLLPDLQQLVPAGWDPHQGRLVSTWLDPNFFGAACSMLFWYAAGWSLNSLSGKTQSTKHKFQTKHKAQTSQNTNSPRLHIWNLCTSVFCAPFGICARRCSADISIWSSLILALTSLLALFATQSRSSIIALVAGALVFVPAAVLAMRRLSVPHRIASSVVAGTALLLILAAAPLLRERLAGLVWPDATYNQRHEALLAAWPLARDHTLLGAGYNAYQYAAQQAGLIKDFTIHSRAGADNSYLTLWVTGGLTGLILFAVPGAYLAQQLLARTAASNVAAGALAGLVSLAVHALFVNSLLYSHLLLLLSLIIAAALVKDKGGTGVSSLHSTPAV